ncbi:MAG: GT4 family glycosyltransferase PelF, partial [Thiomonas sp.]
GYAAGVPAVTTDVGSCRQLIYGLGEEDEALGPSGAVVGIADAQALGEACAELLGDPARWQAASQAAITRVERYYTQPIMFDKYRAVYQDALQRSAARAAGFADTVGAVATWLRGEPPLDADGDGPDSPSQPPPPSGGGDSTITAAQQERNPKVAAPADAAEPPQGGGSP